MKLRVVGMLVCMLLMSGSVACGGDDVTPPPPGIDAGPHDAAVDAPSFDGGADAGPGDAGSRDSGPQDAGPAFALCRSATTVSMEALSGVIGAGSSVTVRLELEGADWPGSCHPGSGRAQAALWVPMTAGDRIFAYVDRNDPIGPRVEIASDCSGDPARTACDSAVPDGFTFAIADVALGRQALVIVSAPAAADGSSVRVDLSVTRRNAPWLTSGHVFDVGHNSLVINVTGHAPDGNVTEAQLGWPDVGTRHPFLPEPTGRLDFSGSAGAATDVLSFLDASGTVQMLVIADNPWLWGVRVRVPIEAASLVGFGESCDTTHACSPTLICEMGTCAQAAGRSACELVSALSHVDLTGAVAPVVVRQSLLSTRVGPVFTSCEALQTTLAILQVTLGAADLVATLAAVGGGPPLDARWAVWVGGECGDLTREVACERAPTGPVVGLLPSGASGHEVSILVGNWDVSEARDAEVTLRARPVLASGAPCDPAGDANRCAAGACSASAVCP
jgi:hypothetical protein